MWRHPRDPHCPSVPRHPCPCPPPQDTGLASTSLRTLTERLRELAQGTQSLVLGGLPAGADHRPPPLTLLAQIVDLVGAAKGLFSWLNRSGAGGGTHGCWVPPVPGAELSVPFPPNTLQVPLLHPQRLFGQPGHRPALRPAGRDAAGGGCPGRLPCPEATVMGTEWGEWGGASRLLSCPPKLCLLELGGELGSGEMWYKGLPCRPPLDWDGSGAEPSHPTQPRVLSPPQDCPAAERDSRILWIVSAG